MIDGFAFREQNTGSSKRREIFSEVGLGTGIATLFLLKTRITFIIRIHEVYRAVLLHSSEVRCSHLTGAGP